jgi:hypothetical protein
MEFTGTERELISNGFKLFFESCNWTDVVVKIDHYDDYTRQLFVTAEGKWYKTRRLELEDYLKKFSKKVKVSTIVYGTGGADREISYEQESN